MKSYLTTLTILMLCLPVFSQKSIKIEGKTNFNLEYYYDSNTGDKKNAIMQDDGTYQIKIHKKSKSKKITIHKQGNNWCKQVLELKNLRKFSETNKSKIIINDATHINSCLKEDVMATKEFSKYVGVWLNENYRIHFFCDQDYILKFTNSDGNFRRVGASKIISDNELILNSRYILSEFTNTLINNNESISFLLNENGNLESKALGVELIKQKR